MAHWSCCGAKTLTGEAMLALQAISLEVPMSDFELLSAVRGLGGSKQATPVSTTIGAMAAPILACVTAEESVRLEAVFRNEHQR
jgi:hypothetical protein